MLITLGSLKHDRNGALSNQGGTFGVTTEERRGESPNERLQTENYLFCIVDLADLTDSYGVFGHLVDGTI